MADGVHAIRMVSRQPVTFYHLALRRHAVIMVNGLETESFHPGAGFERGYDDGMTQAEKQFLYMPLMHSEVLADQELSVKMFRDLGNEHSLKYAIEHRDIVARFGRFPHRNQALGRTSTQDEADFLKGHGGYGQ
jgi:uncharacterized protein (DUF924 family)